MEFATAARRRRHADADAATASAARRAGHGHGHGHAPAAAAAAAALQTAWSEAEPRLRAAYAHALEAHAAGDSERAQQLYQDILAHALLDPAGLQPAQPRASSLGADTDETALACAVRRLTLRSLALNNAAALAQQQADGGVEAADSAHDAFQQPTSGQRKVLQRSLQLHLDALEAGAALTQMRSRLEREKLRIETGVAACTIPAAAATRGVADASLWLRTARAALALDQLPLARASLESAFQLRSDSWPVIDLLLDVLYSLSDWAALQRLLQHALALDPWHVQAMLMQRHVWMQHYPDANAADSCAFAELDARLCEQVQPQELELAERHLAALEGRYNGLCTASFSSDEQPQLLIRRWDCTAETPSFAGLAQQVVTLYAELIDLTRSEDPLRTLPCVVRDGKFVPVQIRPDAQQGLSLTLPVAFQIEEALPPAQPEAQPSEPDAPAQTAGMPGASASAAVPASEDGDDVAMADASSHAAPAAAADATAASSAAASADRRNFSLAGEAPAAAAFTYVDPIRECEVSSVSPTPAQPGGDRSQVVLQQKQQQRDLVLDVLRLGWTDAEKMRADPAVEVDPLFFCMRHEGARARSASPTAVDPAVSALASTATAASAGAAAASAVSPIPLGAAAERLEVLQFLHSHALASAARTDNSIAVQSSSDVGSLAQSLLRYLHSHPHLVAGVDPAALTCLVQAVHATAPPAEFGEPVRMEQIQMWLFLAEVAHEAHRSAHPNPLSGAATGTGAAVPTSAAASSSSGAAADVIDLTAGSPSPLLAVRAPFRPPRRWKSRHPSALAVADHFLALLLLAQSPPSATSPKPASALTTALLADSVPLQLRWSWLLAQRALHSTAAAATESQQARAEQVTSATAHLHRCVELFAAHRDVSSVSLAHLPRQGGPLTRARLEQSLALLRVSQLIQSATRASLKGQHRAVLHLLRGVVRDAVAPAAGSSAADSELGRLPSNERTVVLRLLQSSAESERDHVALLLHALLSLRHQSAHFLSLMRAKLPVAKEHKQQAYDALDAVWAAWRKVGADKMAACLLAMFQKDGAERARSPPAAGAAEHKTAEAAAAVAATPARSPPYAPDEFFSLSLFRSLQSDIGVCMALALRGALHGTAKELMCQAMKIAMQVGLALGQAQLRADQPRMHARLVELHVLRLELHFLRAIHRVLAAYDICGEACGRVFLSIMLNRMYEPREALGAAAGADGAFARSLLAPSKDGTLIKLMGECSVGPSLSGESSSAGPTLRPGPPLEGVSWDELAPIPFDNYFRVSWLAVISANALLAPPFFARPVQQRSDAHQQHSNVGESSMDDVGDREGTSELQRSCRQLVESCRALLVSETGQCLSCLHGVLKQPHARHANTPREFVLPVSSRTVAATSAQAQLIRERVWSFLVVHYRQQLQQIRTTLLQWHANQAAIKRVADERQRAKRRKVDEGASASRDGDGDGDDDASVGSGSTSSARDADEEHDWYDTLRVDVWLALDVLEAHLASQQLKPDAVRFIEQFLAAPPSAALEDSYRPVLLQASLPPDQDDFDERLYRFYLGVVLPAFLQRTEDASRMAHRAGTSRDMDSMHASLQRIVRFNLLSDARSVVCWSAMAMMHWEASMSQLYAHYADVALLLNDPAVHGTSASPAVAASLLDAPLVVTKMAASKQLLAKWIGDWFRFYRCAMLALHLLHTQHGVGARPAAVSPNHDATSSTLQPCVCCSGSLSLVPVRVDANNGADRSCTHAHLAVELWEKVASGVDMLSTLARALTSFDQHRDAVAAAAPTAAAAAATASSAPSSAARIPDSTALDTLVQFLQQPEVGGVQLSFRCWQSAALVQDRNGLLLLLQAKAARKVEGKIEARVLGVGWMRDNAFKINSHIDCSRLTLSAFDFVPFSAEPPCCLATVFAGRRVDIIVSAASPQSGVSRLFTFARRIVRPSRAGHSQARPRRRAGRVVAERGNDEHGRGLDVGCVFQLRWRPRPLRPPPHATAAASRRPAQIQGAHAHPTLPGRTRGCTCRTAIVSLRR